MKKINRVGLVMERGDVIWVPAECIMDIDAVARENMPKKIAQELLSINSVSAFQMEFDYHSLSDQLHLFGYVMYPDGTVETTEDGDTVTQIIYQYDTGKQRTYYLDDECGCIYIMDDESLVVTILPENDIMEIEEHLQELEDFVSGDSDDAVCDSCCCECSGQISMLPEED